MAISSTAVVLAQVPELTHLPGFYEPCSAISHLFGAGLFLFLGALLLRRGWGDRGRLILLGIYAVSCVLLLSLSGVYHMMERGSTARVVMERLDHAAIFVLIAGTATPAHGLLLHGLWRWAMLFFTWTVAITGITIKTIFFHYVPEWLGLSCYLGFGWIGFFSAIHLGRLHGFGFIKPLLLGGVVYSVGASLEYFGWLVFIPGMVHPHEVFHLAVLAAALLHWLFIWQFATGEIYICWPASRLLGWTHS
jgi:channel protein (hemolysin III family)